MQERHLDCESEEVIDKCVEELVGHGFSWHVRDRFESVVDVEGGNHHEESVCVDGADECGDHEGVP